MEQTVRINAGELTVGLLKSNHGIKLSSLRDKKRSRGMLTWPATLFTLTAERLSDGEKITVTSGEGWESVQALKTSEGAVVICSGNKALEGVTVTLTAVCSHNTVEWQTSISSVNTEYTLVSCDHPVLTVDCGVENRFFYPYGSGEVYSTEKKKHIENAQSYPSYGVSMQYMAFYSVSTGRGLYYGLHDPAPAYKRLCFKKKSGESCIRMHGEQPLSGIDKGGNSQTLCGKCVWKLFDGDWYDAAIIYRNWVEAEAEFLRTPARKQSEWFVKAPHWWLVHIGDDESFADDILEATKTLGTDSPVHLYLWHNAPFDNDYPHYFPLRPHARRGIDKLQKNGVRVMPYINGRLWDTRDRKAEDFEFTSVAKPYATKDRHGVCFTETYSSKEEDGSKVCLSIMCPSTALWQEKMAYTVGKLFNEERFDAVYMDQIAAAQPYACCDKNHPHPAGGGEWWCRSYRSLLDRIYRSLPEDASITTECTADPFVSHMGGYLSWLWIRDGQVPAFPVIYSKYITMFGRSYQSDNDEDWSGLRIFISQSLCYGEQLGWIAPKKFNENPYKDFYISCVRTREKLGKYFYVGSETLRPPVTESTLPRLRTEQCSQAIGGIVEENAVLGCIRRSEDGGLLLLTVNAGKEGGTVTVKTDLIADGKYGEFTFKNGVAEVYMPPLSVKYTEI